MDSVKSTIRQAERKAEKLYDRGHEAVDHLEKTARKAVKDPESLLISLVKKFPGTTLAGALLLGFYAGARMNSRR